MRSLLKVYHSRLGKVEEDFSQNESCLEMIHEHDNGDGTAWSVSHYLLFTFLQTTTKWKTAKWKAIAPCLLHRGNWLTTRSSAQHFSTTRNLLWHYPKRRHGSSFAMDATIALQVSRRRRCNPVGDDRDKHEKHQSPHFTSRRRVQVVVCQHQEATAMPRKTILCTSFSRSNVVTVLLVTVGEGVNPSHPPEQ